MARTLITERDWSFKGIVPRGTDGAEDPFLRCGLLFAGAANWLCGEKLPDTFGDGVLNGLDIVSLDLSKYKLVVLAACQTGLGETGKGGGNKRIATRL